MEHRYGCREPAHVRVMLFKQGLPVAVGCVVNISHYGLFIETEYADVQKNQIVEFELLHSSAQDRQRWRAALIHKGANGLGFELRDIVPEFPAFEINPLSFAASS
jgi:hypothetical protein